MVPGKERPWLKNYAPGVRPHLDYPEVPLYRFLDDAVAGYPEATATIFFGTELTYRSLGNMVDKMAGALAGMGIKKGDRVAVMLPNCPQLVVAYYGVLKAGAVVVMTNPMYMEKEITHQLNDAGAETIIVLDLLYPRVQNVRESTALKSVVVASLFPGASAPDNTIGFDELINRAEPEPPQVKIDPKVDLALLQYTGGTTGVAKGAMLTHYNLVVNTIQCKEVTGGNFQPGEEKILEVLPLFHVYGMTAGMNLAVAVAGAQILIPRFEIDWVLQAINDCRPTLFPGAPTIYIAVLNHPKIEEYDISSIKFCLSGSASLPVEVAAQFERLTGGRLVEGYGLTETSPVVAVNPLFGVRKPGSIGQPVPDTDCRIVDLETGERELPAGETGELIVRGPQVMKGYWNMPEETALVLRNGWLYTGDIARMDEDGYIFIVDRKKDLIIAGGFNIYPRDVEEILYEHSKVAEAAVIGVPDEYRGETVKAFIVLKEGETAAAEEIIAFCRERLAAYKIPRIVEFREQLPKTIIGKVLRRVLMEEEEAKRQAAPGG
ncbi:MAG: long-chain fatty acid--CoA ligase [Peptococcaceae bacterium]|nr:MAG: long-chain fatty acid--CoA ligase [Peptococcaceae bacterium]